MNYLEAIICDYLIDNDVEYMTTKQVAEHFFVSRALVYKALNKMGYSSFEKFKQEKHNYQRMTITKLSKHELDNSIDKLVDSIYFAGNIFVIGYHQDVILVDYFSRQLINLQFIAISITDSTQISSYLKLVEANDLVILISNSGTNVEEYNKLKYCQAEQFVITSEKSMLYKHAANRIGITKELSSLSDVFERESLFESLDTIQRVLFRIYAYKLSMKVSKESTK